MPQNRVAVTHMGAIAGELLASDQSASMMGVSSRGIFLRLQASWVLFLSYEQYRGPLTLNLGSERRGVSWPKQGAALYTYSGRKCILSTDLEIDYGVAESWQAPQLPGGLLSNEQSREVLQQIIAELSRLGKTSALAGHLPGLLSRAVGEDMPGETVSEMLAALRQAMDGQDAARIVAAVQPLLGMGAGLTPSGDDLALGLVLALNRWGHVLAPNLHVSALSQEVVRQAYTSTTLLSANLIECACWGQADERLIIALDGILSGSYDPALCAASLASWGNTSGIDALVGMGLALANIA